MVAGTALAPASSARWPVPPLLKGRQLLQAIPRSKTETETIRHPRPLTTPGASAPPTPSQLPLPSYPFPATPSQLPLPSYQLSQLPLSSHYPLTMRPAIGSTGTRGNTGMSGAGRQYWRRAAGPLAVLPSHRAGWVLVHPRRCREVLTAAASQVSSALLRLWLAPRTRALRHRSDHHMMDVR